MRSFLLILLLLALALPSTEAGEPPVRERRAAEPDDGPDRALPLGRLAGEAYVEGRIERTSHLRGRTLGDEDWIRFESAAPDTLVALLEMPEKSDFDLALFDSEGRRLATSRAGNGEHGVGREESLLHPLPQAGTYYLAVLGYGGRPGDWSLAFRLQSTPPLGPTAKSVAWMTLPPLVEPRAHHAVAELHAGGAWIAGGTRDATSPKAALAGALRTTERYDASTRTFAKGPDLSFPRFAPTATTLPTGRVLVAGGDILGTADLMDPWQDHRVTGRAISLGGMRVLHTATLLPDGRVLIAGGSTVRLLPKPREARLATTTVFDPKTRTFTAGPRLRASRSSHAATLLRDGRVLLIGGAGRDDTEIVDLRSIEARVLAGPKLPHVLDDHTATTLLDGRVLVLGGQGRRGVSLATALHRPEGGAFAALPAEMAAPRADHQVVRLADGSVLVLGGETDPGGGAKDVLLDLVERFDPKTRTFAPWPKLPYPADDHRATRLLDGTLLVTGGVDGEDLAVRGAALLRPR